MLVYRTVKQSNILQYKDRRAANKGSNRRGGAEK